LVDWLPEKSGPVLVLANEEGRTAEQGKLYSRDISIGYNGWGFHTNAISITSVLCC